MVKKQPEYKAQELRPPRELTHVEDGHLPAYDDNKEATRCKLKGCTQRSHFFCKKCNVHLCIVKGRICFTEFHSKK